MSNTISRRDLLKGAVAGAAGIATMGVLSACGDKTEQVIASAPGVSPSPSASPAPAPLSAPAVYKAGTYTSVQHSSYATVEVSCTFSESALTDVKYQVLHTSHSDYFTPFASPMEQYCKRIVENGKTDGVDGVTGASLCTKAIRDGVNACTAQALGLSAAPAPLNPQEEGYDTFEGDCAEVFSPIKLGSMTLSNRTVKSAGGWTWANAEGSELPVTTEFYGTMAENGVALTILAYWDLFGLGLLPDDLEMGDAESAAAAIKPLLDRTHAAGGKLGFQLCFGGGAPIVPDSFINETPISELDAFVENVGVSAQRVKAAGMDCIEIKGASADALNGFLTRRVNKREDEYGPQSIENRTRLFRRIIGKIKEVNGKDFPVGALINAVEENDVILGSNELFITIEESKAIAKALVDAGADWIQLRVGVNGQEMNIWAPDVQHIAPGFNGITGNGTQFDYSAHYGGLMDGSHSGFGSFLPMVKAIKEAVSVPVGCAAADLRVGPDYLNDAIKRGELDLIFMCRPLYADPELVRKIKEHDREDIRPCAHCMHCHDTFTMNGLAQSACRMNANVCNAYTETMPEGFVPTPAAVKKNVMVIGAGPAGMEAAQIAAQRGHKVTIYDSADKLGGLLHFARGVKGDHERFDDYVTYAAHQLEKNGVEVKLMTKVDAALVKEQKPDAVVLAVGGARESKLSGDNVFSPEDAFGSNKLGQNVVVLGGSVQAIDFAAWLVSTGRKVTIVHGKGAEMADWGQSGWFRTYMLPHLQSKGTKIWHNASVKGLSGDGLTITTDVGLTKVIPCDSVVEFYDMVPNTSLAKEIEAAGIEVHAVGDCAEPYNIKNAILTGNLCARAL